MKQSKKNKKPDKFSFEDSPYCDYDVIRTLPTIGETQFIDCGWNILLLSNNECFRNKYRSAMSQINRMIHKDTTATGYYFTCEPNNKKVMHFKCRVLYFCSSLSTRSLMEVIVHEVSHLVDYIFEFAHITSIDTEFRAYLNDYYCGKLFDMMDLSNAGSKPRFLLDKAKTKARKIRTANNAERIALLAKEIKKNNL